MKVILDGARVRSRRGLHKYLKRALRLPDYYGKNLDALYDCLTDLHEDVALVIAHPEDLQSSLGSYEKGLMAVLLRSAQENDHLTLTVLPDE